MYCIFLFFIFNIFLFNSVLFFKFQDVSLFNDFRKEVLKLQNSTSTLFNEEYIKSSSFISTRSFLSLLLCQCFINFFISF